MRLGTRKRLGRRMETAPLDVRTEDEPNLIADVKLAAVDAPHVQSGTVVKLQRELERRLPAHAAGHMEYPLREPSRWIGLEARYALGVQFARIALALEPAPRPRPQDEPVGRHVRIRVRREKRIILARDPSPSGPHLRGRAAAVRQDRAGIRPATDLIARHRQGDARHLARRRNQQSGACALRPVGSIRRETEVKHAAPRAVTLVLRREENRNLAVRIRRIRRRTAGAMGTALARVDEIKTEAAGRGHLDPLMLGHDDVAPEVVGIGPVEDEASVRLCMRGTRNRPVCVLPMRMCDGSSATDCLEAKDLSRRETDASGQVVPQARHEVRSVPVREAVAVPVDRRPRRTVEVREEQDIRCAGRGADDRQDVARSTRDEL